MLQTLGSGYSTDANYIGGLRCARAATGSVLLLLPDEIWSSRTGRLRTEAGNLVSGYKTSNKNDSFTTPYSCNIVETKNNS